MIKKQFVILIIILLIIALWLASIGIIYVLNQNNNIKSYNLDQKFKPIEFIIPVRYKIDITDVYIMKENVLVTCYSNRPEETDSTPNITATGRLVYDGSCAVSQDLFRKTVHPGDFIYIVKLNKWFIVEDTTNIRHQKLVDIFYFKDEPKPFTGAIRSDIYIVKRR